MGEGEEAVRVGWGGRERGGFPAFVHKENACNKYEHHHGVFSVP